MAPGDLAQVLRQLNSTEEPNLLVGTATGDDAAVWRLTDDRALVVTADFITPVVDEARSWGRVAATNAVSDIYAMGARPLLALNLVAWNTAELSTELLGEVLTGAQDVATEGGFVIAGGHTVDDPEPKFGLAVVGEAHPDRLLTNSGFRPGDTLILSKALGIGAITTGIKRGQASAESINAALSSMSRLNDQAAAVALEAEATGATDVTGFGLLGHLGRAATESGLDVEIDVAAVPVLPGARELAVNGVVPGGSERNLAWVADRLDQGQCEDVDVMLLADAQTSGGLLFGIESGLVKGVVDELVASGHQAAAIGSLTAGNGMIRLI